MPHRTREERLFGAACLRVTLERTMKDPTRSEIYLGALEDLGLSDPEVLRYLESERPRVEEALSRRRPR